RLRPHHPHGHARPGHCPPGRPPHRARPWPSFLRYGPARAQRPAFLLPRGHRRLLQAPLCRRGNPLRPSSRANLDLHRGGHSRQNRISPRGRASRPDSRRLRRISRAAARPHGRSSSRRAQQRRCSSPAFRPSPRSRRRPPSPPRRAPLQGHALLGRHRSSPASLQVRAHHQSRTRRAHLHLPRPPKNLPPRQPHSPRPLLPLRDQEVASVSPTLALSCSVGILAGLLRISAYFAPLRYLFCSSLCSSLCYSLSTFDTLHLLNCSLLAVSCYP